MDERLSLLSLSLLASLAPAQEWSQFRGPNGQGHGAASALPAVWTKQDVRWRVAAGGKGHASPVLWGAQLIFTRVVGPGKRQVVCLDADTGEERWATDCAFTAHRQHSLNSFASATPAVDATGIYIAWSSGAKFHAAAFDLQGKPKWKRPLGGFRAQHGSGASPILHDGAMILANEHEGDGSFLAALDCATGEPRWRIPRKSHPKRGAYSPPVVFRPKTGDARLLFASTAHGLTAVDPATGKVAWELPLEFAQRCVHVPVFAGDRLFLAAGSGGGGRESALIELPHEPKQAPKIARRLRRALPYVPAAIVVGGRLFWFSDGGVASCVDPRTGDVVWRERMPGSFFSSPVAVGETIYIADKAGRLYSLAAGKEFRIKGTFDLGAGVFATPAIARGKMFVRTFDEVVCLGLPAEKTDPGKPPKRRVPRP